MTCEQFSPLLPDFLQGTLNHEQEATVAEHIQKCADCREQVAVWNKLALLPVEYPSPSSRVRFEALLHAYEAGRDDRPAAGGEFTRASRWRALAWLRSPVVAMGWSAALLVLGVVIGNSIFGAPSRSPELTALRSELSNMRQLVVLSMLQQQSASERLQGVTFSRRDAQLDPQILSALLHTLRYDTSVDVRLAALDALSRHRSQPQVHSGVVEALQAQQSPLVQVALIDLLTEWRDPGAAQHIQELRRNPGLNPTVRQRADLALTKLN